MAQFDDEIPEEILDEDGEIDVLKLEDNGWSFERGEAEEEFDESEITEISISVDNNGEMNCKELEKSIQIDLKNNLSPFYVNTTAGATVLGSFDHFDEISKICKKYNLW